MRWGGKRGGRESVGGTCVSWTFQSAYLSAHFPEGDLETAVSRGEGRGGGGGRRGDGKRGERGGGEGMGGVTWYVTWYVRACLEGKGPERLPT